MKKFWLVGLLLLAGIMLLALAGVSLAAAGFALFNFMPAEAETAVITPVSLDKPCQEHLGTPEFYQCREDLFACGEEGYYLGYAHKYCDRFQTETRPLMTAAGQDWLDCTLVCLQEHVMNNIPVEASCDATMESAIAAHNGCYLQCGLCSLPPGDLDLVQNTIDGNDIVLDEVLPVGYTCVATDERSPLPTAAFQTECVIEHGGCIQTQLDDILLTDEEWTQLNAQCRAQTGYQGPDVQPTEAECNRWQTSVAAVLESRGLAMTTGFWRGEYFANRDLAGEPMLVQEDKELSFDWGNDAPVGLPDNDFSARWSRSLTLLPGRYLYLIDAQGGVRLWVNGELQVDQWQTSVAEPITGELELSGGLTAVELAYRTDAGAAGVDFVWTQVPNLMRDR
jgi:hypothetical protein